MLRFSVDNETKQTKRPKLVKLKPVSRDSSPAAKPMKASSVFFLGLFWAISLVCIMKNMWILELLTIPFGIYVIKKMLVYVGTDNSLYQYSLTTYSRLKQWAMDRKDVLAPAPVRGLVRAVLLGDKKV